MPPEHAVLLQPPRVRRDREPLLEPEPRQVVRAKLLRAPAERMASASVDEAGVVLHPFLAVANSSMLSRSSYRGRDSSPSFSMNSAWSARIFSSVSGRTRLSVTVFSCIGYARRPAIIANVSPASRIARTRRHDGPAGTQRGR